MLGAMIDTIDQTKAYLGFFINRLRRQGMQRQYQQIIAEQGKTVAMHKLCKQVLTPISTSILLWSKAPFIILYTYTPYRKREMASAKGDFEGGAIIEVKMGPLNPKDFYTSLHNEIFETLVHEFQHVPQMRNRPLELHEPRIYTTMSKEDPRRWRVYFSDPREIPAFSAQAAFQLLNHGVYEVDYPFSPEALDASPVLRVLTREFSGQVGWQHKIIKRYVKNMKQLMKLYTPSEES